MQVSADMSCLAFCTTVTDSSEAYTQKPAISAVDTQYSQWCDTSARHSACMLVSHQVHVAGQHKAHYDVHIM